MTQRHRATIAAIAFAGLSAAAACGGIGTPNGPTVNSPGGPTQPPTNLVNVDVTVTIPGVRPGYVSPNTQSLVIQLASVDGGGVTGVNATTIETQPGAKDCKQQASQTVCSATALGSPGDDVFSVTTYAGTNATGPVLSAGTVQARIDSGGGGVQISNRLSLTLNGVVASLRLSLSPNDGKRGDTASSSVTLDAFDATRAQIVGRSDFLAPIALTIQGDAQQAFRLHAGSKSGSSLSIVRPTSGIRLTYDGNRQASTVTIQASVDGPSSISAHARFTLHGKQPPPPVGTIYALNLGSNDGLSATVTEYDGKAKGNAAPKRTLQLSTKLYARSIAVDASGNLYVGFFDSQFGFSPSNGQPDAGNLVAIYAPDASGNTKPTALLTANKKTNTTLFPLFMSFDPSGDLVTYGATSVDGNTGDAVLTYPPGSKGSVAPADGWAFVSPLLTYAGPTGLALDLAGNFYVNGALHTALGPSYGVFVAPASDKNNPAVNPSRTIPWDSNTKLTPGFTTNVALDSSGEIVVGNALLLGPSSSRSCQGRMNVFAAGPSGGSTDVKPLRILQFDGVLTSDPACYSTTDPRPFYFPAISLFGTSVFVADDFNNAIDGYPAAARGSVKPTLTLAGSATQLDAPIALVITKVSGRAMAGPVNQHPDALHAR
ncbi:MAG: hypothetical protein WB681_13890 [Candidatus Cybelea sp.]